MTLGLHLNIPNANITKGFFVKSLGCSSKILSMRYNHGRLQVASCSLAPILRRKV